MSAAFIRTVAAAALGRFDMVADWLGIGGGKNQGREYLPTNPTRADTKPGSFTFNRDSGAWADFATEDKGGDLVSLVAYLHGIKQGEAADRLAQFLGIENPTLQNAPETTHARRVIRRHQHLRKVPPAGRHRRRTATHASCLSPPMAIKICLTHRRAMPTDSRQPAMN